MHTIEMLYSLQAEFTEATNRRGRLLERQGLNMMSADWRRPRGRDGKFCASGACVEVAVLQTGVIVRDTKQSHLGTGVRPVLRFNKEEWAQFIDAVKAGEFDGTAS